MKKVIVMVATACLFLAGCSDSPSSSSGYDSGNSGGTGGYTVISDDNGGPSSPGGDYDTYDNSYFTCQMCGGSGMMVYFDGTPITCISCNGRGGFTQTELQQMAEEALNHGGGNSGGYYDNGDGYNSNGSSRDAYLIENDLRKAREFLNDL